MPRPYLVALVVTFNRLEPLKVTIARLLDEPVDRIVVLNNASTDGTADWLTQQAQDRLEIITSPVNTGGAGGFETGMREVMHRHDPDWLVVMDDDARPYPGAITAFRAMDLGAWDSIAGAVYYPDGRICPMNQPVKDPFRSSGMMLKTLAKGRAAFHMAPERYTSHGATEVDGASFVGLFLSRKAVQTGGYPDGRMFLYGDDTLYTLAMTKAGIRMAFIPDIRFEHACSTFSGAGNRFSPLWKVYFYHRNLMLLYRQTAGWLFWPSLALILPKWLLKAAVHPGDRLLFLKLLGLAIADGLRGRLERDLADVKALTAGR